MFDIRFFALLFGIKNLCMPKVLINEFKYR